MKKLVLSACLLSMVGTASGMHLWYALQSEAETWNMQRKEAGKDEIGYLPIVYPVAVIGGFVGTSCALVRLAKAYFPSENTLAPAVNQLPQINQPLMPSAASEWSNSFVMNNSTKLLLMGAGLTSLSMYLGYKNSQQKNKTVTQNAAGGSNLNIVTNFDFDSLYTLAPLVPAYFCFKYGFAQLNK